MEVARRFCSTVYAFEPQLFEIPFPEQNWEKGHLTNLSPRKVRNLFSFNFLSMPCPDWTVQMVLTNSRVPE